MSSGFRAVGIRVLAGFVTIACRVRSSERRVAMEMKRGLRVVGFQFRNVGEQFVFLSQSGEVVANHLVGP